LVAARFQYVLHTLSHTHTNAHTHTHTHTHTNLFAHLGGGAVAVNGGIESDIQRVHAERLRVGLYGIVALANLKKIIAIVLGLFHGFVEFAEFARPPMVRVLLHTHILVLGQHI
jgi:hypothetical protein